jgi:hypothetical protein
MQPMKFLFSLLRVTCQNIHKKRLECLLAASEACLKGKKLSLVALGRNLSSKAKTKHNIKRIDRLLGNKKLNKERDFIYKTIAQALLNGERSPVVIVDWSGLTKCGEYLLLRAAIPIGGRAITIYEETYPEKNYDNREVNNNFLYKLKEILPVNCVPIIITDAGFKNPWFKAVEELGWHWIGRIRSLTHFRWCGSKTWIPVRDLHKKATLKPQSLGAVELAKSNPLTCNFFLYKQKNKYRQQLNLRGHKVRCSVSLKHARREREPWLLASSLPINDNIAEKIIKIYKMRMQIEESFRDIKNQRFGFSLSEMRSRNINRFNILLLIGAIASLAAHIIGKMAYQKNEHYAFQSNSVKDKNVLSLFFIGCEMYKRKRHAFAHMYLFILQQLYHRLVV